MDAFIKVLKSEESGYTKDTPGERGEYIRIFKNSWHLFPPLSKTKFNDTKILKFYTKDHHSIALNIVYNNAKYFLHLGLKRDHDEVRIYRNKSIDNLLSLDRHVIVVIIKLSDDEYYIESIQKTDIDYLDFESIAKECLKNGKVDTEKLRLTKRFSDLSNVKKTDTEIENIAEIVKSTTEHITKGNKARTQQKHHPDDPAGIFSSLIKNQTEFARFIREIYDNKCAIRGTSLIEGQHVGLEAAHIKSASHKGPLLPSNGILMSSDLHKCFDQGFFGLNDDNEIIISSTVPKTSVLYQYKGLKIKPKDPICSPFHEYNRHHRSEHKLF
ncbi:hypothetical protein BTO10_09865 [Vibrio chagasii]|uniref:HNH nuclease domain-containing protein n=1 Tax=Vibrio chagasii TaxID=170679 RepID=A0A2S7VDV8_9VIBR|nr:HNH endonuclease [Vibrio chagasii]PQJ59711.1 hypothetical protein BTO10_09865 [Vibrio chagasii]